MISIQHNADKRVAQNLLQNNMQSLSWIGTAHRGIRMTADHFCYRLDKVSSLRASAI